MSAKEQAIREILKMEASSTPAEERLAYSQRHRGGHLASLDDVSEWSLDVVTELKASKAYEYIQKIKAVLQLTALESRIRHLEETTKRHEETIRAQGESLNLLLKEEPLPPVGGFAKWLASTDAQQFLGKEVAFLDGEVVATADSVDELWDKIQDDPRCSKMALGRVPHGGI